jgi:hypothetical protein
MSKLRAGAFISFLCITAALTGRALACSMDAECDNGDVCSVPDTCVAGSCVLGGGGDPDGDLVCDGEYDPTKTMKVNRVVAKTLFASKLGKLRVLGSFIDDLDSPTGAFIADDGISVRVKDALSSIPPPGDGFDVTIPFDATNCTTSLNGVQCKAVHGATRSVANFKRNRLAPEQIGFLVRVKNVDLTRPFFGPVQVIVSYHTRIHRRDDIIDCALLINGIKCREY